MRSVSFEDWLKAKRASDKWNQRASNRTAGERCEDSPFAAGPKNSGSRVGRHIVMYTNPPGLTPPRITPARLGTLRIVKFKPGAFKNNGRVILYPLAMPTEAE
ncbi:unnamed protein product [Hermetia illucens]|uniref:Uncharacterized protein n=1 Tax=Hermetia illucens TaxID=343691 RepID=A0A7R8UNU0_HERIL|nr:unnamed protein product [Hermetia illucens]